MLPGARNRFLDEKGSALVLTAVVMVGLLAMASLAVDIGMAITARSEAQRVADSCALAGASAFIDAEEVAAPAEASDRAYEYALKNVVRNVGVDSSQVTLQILADSAKVRCWISARGLPTWFATFLGIDGLDVQAMAAAKASEAGRTDRCVLPMAIADIWGDEDDDWDPADRIPNGEEFWEYEPEEGDTYDIFDGVNCNQPSCDYNGTGFGSNYRNVKEGWNELYAADFGRRLWIKGGAPGRAGMGEGGEAGGTDVMTLPGNFKLWAMPDIGQDCEPRTGGTWVGTNILVCNECPITVGTDYITEPGNTVSIKEEMDQLFNEDPTASWNTDTNTLDSVYGEDSPRVRYVPLWDPVEGVREEQIDGRATGRFIVQFNNFARIFIENAPTPPEMAIYARFMGIISGEPGPDTGSLIMYLRLVE
jgi:hypothetical protein